VFRFLLAAEELESATVDVHGSGYESYRTNPEYASVVSSDAHCAEAAKQFVDKCVLLTLL
jgi:hypothetical protein